jgi:undecaprenyl phosphate-alpha-L-ara4N flippase subunit ArnE
MSATAIGILLVCLCAVIEAFAQVALKISAATAARWLPWIAAAIGLFMIRALVYSSALRFLNVSVAFAIDTLSLVTVTLLSMLVLRERVTPIRWIGIGLIVLGASFVAAHA